MLLHAAYTQGEAVVDPKKAAREAEKAAKAAAKAARVSCCDEEITRIGSPAVGPSPLKLHAAWRSHHDFVIGVQAAQRGQKQAVSTQADPDDPLKDHYGDTELVQSQLVTNRKWTDVLQLTPELKGQKVAAAPEEKGDPTSQPKL